MHVKNTATTLFYHPPIPKPRVLLALETIFPYKVLSNHFFKPLTHNNRDNKKTFSYDTAMMLAEYFRPSIFQNRLALDELREASLFTTTLLKNFSTT